MSLAWAQKASACAKNTTRSLRNWERSCTYCWTHRHATLNALLHPKWLRALCACATAKSLLNPATTANTAKFMYSEKTKGGRAKRHCFEFGIILLAFS